MRNTLTHLFTLACLAGLTQLANAEQLDNLTL